MNEDFAKKIDDNIEDLPGEVSDFIFGEGLEKALVDITDFLETPEQKQEIKNDITFYLLGVTAIDEIVEYIDSLKIPDERKLEIKKKIQEEVIDELLLIIEANRELEADAKNPIQTQNISAAAANLSDRLNTSTIRPSKQDRDILAPVPQVPKKDPTSDPYHEPIE
jgi:hypothetical protein